MKQDAVTIRPAGPNDMADVHRLICELAVFERAGDEVIVTPEQLITDGFSSQPRFEVVIAESNDETVGMALYYPRYSTWKGLCYYLEDLIVTEAWRGRGLGKKLLIEVARAAHNAGAHRLQWQVLDWNVEAIDFYTALGAFVDREWFDCKLDKTAIEQLINRS
jgi:GNAT superfamily N-acetyltransferase